MSLCVKKIGVSFSAILVLVGALVQTASAQSDATTVRDTLFFHSPPSVDEMAQHLFPSKSRAIVVPGKKRPDNSNSDNNVSASAATESSIGMPVLFHFGKAELVEASKPFLDQVGKLMRQPDYLRETLIVEGHTDAVGSNQYNQSLSELRALAVRDYLVSKYDIEPNRLFPQGMGETKLYNTQNPNSQENRRVEFLRFDG